MTETVETFAETLPKGSAYREALTGFARRLAKHGVTLVIEDVIVPPRRGRPPAIIRMVDVILEGDSREEVADAHRKVYEIAWDHPDELETAYKAIAFGGRDMRRVGGDLHKLLCLVVADRRRYN